MSVKVKMRCARCGKSFKSSGAKQTLCQDCEVKVRNERATSKAAAPKAAAPAPAQAPKVVGPGASILVPGLVSTEVSARPERGATGAATETRGRPGQGLHPSHPSHAPQAPAGQAGAHRTAQGATAAHAPHATHERPQRPGRQEGQKQHLQQSKAQKEPKQPRPPTPPMELSDELRQKIEQRYLELANPVEFDGIRTQIAGELGVPKALVKKAVQDLRARTQMPSWWELQSYTGGNHDLERIRRAYLPLLPVPEIGVHKAIAVELGLDPAVVYQGIKRIRAEMHLPRYNPPETHNTGPAGDKQAVTDEQPAIATDAHEVSVGASGGEAQ